MARKQTTSTETKPTSAIARARAVRKQCDPDAIKELAWELQDELDFLRGLYEHLARGKKMAARRPAEGEDADDKPARRRCKKDDEPAAEGEADPQYADAAQS